MAKTGPKPKTIEETFYKRITKTESCWIWNGPITTQGYGQLIFNKKEQRAHRVSLFLKGVTIPIGMVVDHICMNRKCVNPEHLRVVSRKINAIENSNSSGALNKRKTHCLNGHLLSNDNLYKHSKNETWRRCKTCHKESFYKNKYRKSNAQSMREHGSD